MRSSGDENSIDFTCLLSGSWCDENFVRIEVNGVHDGLILPKPIRNMNTINSMNKYELSMSPQSKKNVVIIIRTYWGFQNATQKLLENLDQQKGLRENGISLHAIILSTDLDSASILHSMVESGQYHTSHFRNLHVHFHTFNASTYTDNCCQLGEMCTADKYQSAFSAHMHERYRHYKPSSVIAKRRQFCEMGNNLLHYVLCDAVIEYVIKSTPGPVAASSYIVLTNGDNEYSYNFVSKMVAAMDSAAVPDLVLCDYLERGVGYVKSKIQMNQMDLGALMYRVSFLSRVGVGFIDSLPRPAWPSHYYAADGEFPSYLVNKRGAKWGKVDEVLFTHW